ncbi:MAG TPA: hypothetical protein VF727_14010 [Allosphingosinicella sp.]|jgi:hypothetical protein
MIARTLVWLAATAALAGCGSGDPADGGDEAVNSAGEATSAPGPSREQPAAATGAEANLSGDTTAAPPETSGPAPSVGNSAVGAQGRDEPLPNGILDDQGAQGQPGGG